MPGRLGKALAHLLLRGRQETSYGRRIRRSGGVLSPTIALPVGRRGRLLKGGDRVIVHRASQGASAWGEGIVCVLPG